MIGQDRLISQLKSYTVAEFPHTLLLIGESGCGKHTVVNEVIAPYLQLEVVDMTEQISLDFILEIQLRAIPAIYLINTVNITERQQNALLKLLEEPVSSSYVVILSENKTSLLDTITNRCITFMFESYSKEQLQGFVQDIKDPDVLELVYTVCKTPGQIIKATETKMKELYDLCTKMALRLRGANFANTLTIAQKINYKDEYDKFDINVFFNVLLLVLLEDYKKNNNELSSTLYYKVSEYKTKLQNLKLNREMLMNHMLTTLWKLSRA